MSRLDRVENWEERARSAEYDSTKLAAACLISPTQLRRYFTRFHASPQRLLNELRLWDAANLIRSTERQMKRIAEDLHFADESHFCHYFKSYFGCTPSEFVMRYGGKRATGRARIPERPKRILQRLAVCSRLWEVLSEPRSHEEGD